VNWTAIENALQAWVATASAIPSSRVIWAHQRGAQPTIDFIVLSFTSVDPLGIDPLECLTDLTRPAGQEIELRAGGQRSMVLSLQAFTQSVTGASSARALLSRVQAALGLPSIVASLDAAGVSAYDTGQVQAIPEILQTTFVGRAALEVRFYGREAASEFTGYIDTVLATPEWS
jgi:hypothetical protein